MRLGKVIGEVWGARQAPRLAGHKLLVIRPLRLLGGHTPADDLPKGTRLSDGSASVVAIDTLGAGVGELVLVAHGTRSRDLTYGANVPTKDVVIAIVDDADIDVASAARARR